MAQVAAGKVDVSGVLVMDKPAGLTSHDVVARVRKILGVRQVGHFGTLDPFATGVLPVSAGKATRFAQFYLKSRKAYEGAVRFGFSTDTYDATGNPASDALPVTLEASCLEKHFHALTGRLLQAPPPYSAKRVAGVRAYKLARQHKPVKLEPVEVEIYALELLGIEGSEARFAVECSGGTYVRSLAHDLGQRLGCGAHLARLRRTAVAEFTLAQAVTLEELAGARQEGKLKEHLTPLEALLPDCPELLVRGREETSIRHGRTFELPQALRPGRGGLRRARFAASETSARAALDAGLEDHAPPATLLKILGADRRLIAVARHVSGAVYHPYLVLA